MKHGWMYLYAVMDWYSRYIVDWQLDQGSHFTSPQYIDLLKENEVRISMDGKGRNEYNSPREVRRGVERYIGLQNDYLPHQSL